MSSTVTLNSIKIGADPEFFLEKDGKVVAADSALVPGTKDNPYPLLHGHLQIDGTAIEINVQPSNTLKGFQKSIDGLFEEVNEGLSTHDLKVSRNIVTCEFSESEWDALDDQAKEMGCDPDWNAWTLTKNPRPSAEGRMRSAGGHVHIGWTEGADISRHSDHFLQCAGLARCLDWQLGIPSVLIDTNLSRRKLYGQAGAFRPKPYGMEYRVLSNFWLRESRHTEAVFKTAQRTAFEYLNGGNLDLEENDRVVQIINDSDTEAANLHMPTLGGLMFDYAV